MPHMAGRGALKTPDTLEGSMLLLLIPLLSPQGWDYVFLIGTPAVMLLINDSAALPRGMRFAALGAIAVVGLTIYDLVGRDLYAAFMQYEMDNYLPALPQGMRTMAVIAIAAIAFSIFDLIGRTAYTTFMAELARVVAGTDILIVSDEVYEHIIFDGVRHESMFPLLSR